MLAECIFMKVSKLKGTENVFDAVDTLAFFDANFLHSMDLLNPTAEHKTIRAHETDKFSAISVYGGRIQLKQLFWRFWPAQVLRPALMTALFSYTKIL